MWSQLLCLLLNPHPKVSIDLREHLIGAFPCRLLRSTKMASHIAHEVVLAIRIARKHLPEPAWLHKVFIGHLGRVSNGTQRVFERG
jgi:hypothetical protein